MCSSHLVAPTALRRRAQTKRDAAREVYEAVGAKDKLTMIYAEEGNVDKLVQASGGKPGEQPNYTYLLQVRPSVHFRWCCFALTLTLHRTKLLHMTASSPTTRTFSRSVLFYMLVWLSTWH
jgi:hypothetical protein